MDRSAIEKMQEEKAIVNANNAIGEQNLRDKVLALPNNFALHDLEKFDANRSRLRGQLDTRSVESFSTYAKKNALSDAATFIDANTMTAKLIINLGSENEPGHCDHTAIIHLEKTAPFNALLSIINERKTQKEIAEFIEDWRNYLTASYSDDEWGNRESMPIVKALHAVRKITIEEKVTSDTETRNFGASSSSMESIDVKSSDMPPDYFYFNTEPYFGLGSRTFELRLSIIKERAPALVLRIVRWEEHQEQMAKEFQEKIEESLNEIQPKIATYVGIFKP